MDKSFLTIDSALTGLASGDLTPFALAKSCLCQIERLNPKLNAFITIQPSAIDSQYSNGALYGIPLAVKDLYETAGIKTTAGSKFFKDYIPSQDSFVVEKLKQAGATILGKTNTHEIALGVTTDNPHYGACLNPWDTTRTPGGSSGGSAVAVATGMALGALGTDTGGSIRIPASLCGIVGLKPTYGRVSLSGIFPLSWNLDHAGPLTRTVKDAAIILQVIAHYDPQDPACMNMPTDDYLGHILDGIKGKKIAFAVGEYVDACDSEVLQAIQEARRVFEKLGAIVHEVDMSFLRDAALANGIMTTADGAAYHRERLAEHPDWFGTDVRQRLEIGAAYTSSEYSLARRKQVEARRRFELLFESYDLLLLPTTPIPAPTFEGRDAVEEAKRLTRFTAPFNLTGLPAISLPCGFTKQGLPIGMQLVTKHWAEANLLTAAHAYEQATEWHTRVPEL